MVDYKLNNFYARVDEAVEKLTEIHAARLKCGRGCVACCIDELTVFEIEAENIRKNHAPLLADDVPHEMGACAFLNSEKACRIYEDRPYMCRTQGLPLRWIEEDFEEVIEYRDICPLNENDVPIETLNADECWTIGKFEAMLAELQSDFAGGKMKRESLRSLFINKKPVADLTD